MTVQPAERKRRKFRWSRILFARNFDFQNSDSLCSQVGNRHPCQKSPSMKTATLSFEKTMSGDPSNRFSFRRKRKPYWRSSRWTISSKEPSLSFTAFIARERCSGVKWSGMMRCEAPPSHLFFAKMVLTLPFMFSRTVESFVFAASVKRAVCATASLIGLYSFASLAKQASFRGSFLSTR